MSGRTRFAPEGAVVIGTAAAVLGVVAIVGVAAGHPSALLPFVVGVGFCTWFFRDPEREPPADPRALVSPADGKVIDVSPVQESLFLHAPATKISIFMSPLDVHVNRSPLDGTIVSLQHTPGKFHAAWEDKASLDNERNAMVLEGGGRRFLVVQIAGALARRIVFRKKPGDHCARGERVGMIRFGSRVDLFLPAEAEVAVAPGDKVKAGLTVLARFPEAR